MGKHALPESSDSMKTLQDWLRQPQLNSADPHSGSARSLLSSEFMGRWPNPDDRAHPNRETAKEGEKWKCLIGIVTRAGPAWSNKKNTHKTHMVCVECGGREGGWATLEWCWH